MTIAPGSHIDPYEITREIYLMNVYFDDGM